MAIAEKPVNLYQCHFRPDDVAFNANLQEFAQKVSQLRELEINGKISGVESSQEIKRVWKQIKNRKEKFQTV